MAGTEKVKKAVALSYQDKQDNAPRVVAAGKGETAEKILAIAREHGVPVREEEALAEALSLLGLGEEIPETLYRAVAEILAAVIRIDREK